MHYCHSSKSTGKETVCDFTVAMVFFALGYVNIFIIWIPSAIFIPLIFLNWIFLIFQRIQTQKKIILAIQQNFCHFNFCQGREIGLWFAALEFIYQREIYCLPCMQLHRSFPMLLAALPTSPEIHCFTNLWLTLLLLHQKSIQISPAVGSFYSHSLIHAARVRLKKSWDGQCPFP